MKLSFRFTITILLVLFFGGFCFSQIETLLPSEPSVFVKFPSFNEFNRSLSNIVKILFPNSYDHTIASIKTFFEELLFVDITEVSNLQSLGISTNKEFGFGFNHRGQPFLVIPISTTNMDTRIVSLQNTLYKMNFSSFTFSKDYIIATGRDFEKSRNTFIFTNSYNVFLNNVFFDTIVPFKVPIQYSDAKVFISFRKIESNRISLTIQHTPIVFPFTNYSYRFVNIPYVFQKDSCSMIFEVKLRPIDLLSNISFIDGIVNLGIYGIFTNFERDFGVSLVSILTNLAGPSTFFIYGYNNPLNNKILFVSSVLDQNFMVRVIDSLTREVAKKKDVFKFSIFDKSFYRLPIKEQHNLYFGVIFNRFIVSTDRDILIGFVRNIANDVKEMDEFREFIVFMMNTQPTLNNALRVSLSLHPFLSLVWPFVVQSKTISFRSGINDGSILTYMDLEY